MDGTPRTLLLTSPKTPERDVCLGLLQRCQRNGHLYVLGDKGYAGREFEHAAAGLNATIVRPRRKDEPGRRPHLAPIRQRIESIFENCKDPLTLERHGARTLCGLGTRIRIRFLPSPPRSASTTASAARHAHSPTTRPKTVEQVI